MLTFFYPSTEWRMEQGFECACGEEGCLGEEGRAMAPKAGRTRGGKEDVLQLWGCLGFAWETMEKVLEGQEASGVLGDQEAKESVVESAVTEKVLEDQEEANGVLESQEEKEPVTESTGMEGTAKESTVTESTDSPTLNLIHTVVCEILKDEPQEGLGAVSGQLVEG